MLSSFVPLQANKKNGSFAWSPVVLVFFKCSSSSGGGLKQSVTTLTWAKWITDRAYVRAGKWRNRAGQTDWDWADRMAAECGEKQIFTFDLWTKLPQSQGLEMPCWLAMACRDSVITRRRRQRVYHYYYFYFYYYRKAVKEYNNNHFSFFS